MSSFFYLYEENDYNGIASFITTDAVLQLYHIFFDFTLRNLEEKKLLPVLGNLTRRMINESVKLYDSTENIEIKEAARRNLAFFSVPYYFITKDESKINANILDMVKTEVNRCETHVGRDTPFILNPDKNPKYPYLVYYNQFIPRGHYTRSDGLKRYFMSMLWFGSYCLHPDIERELLQSLIISKQIYDNSLLDLWQTIYEPTAFYVGFSDDLGPDDFKRIIDEVFGQNCKIDDFANKEKLKEALILIEKLFREKTKIRQVVIATPQGVEFRFMGQRYIPDSEIMQRLTKWPERQFPKGLDVMAVFGSSIAKSLLLDKYREQDRWPNYKDTLNVLIGQFGNLGDSDWQENLYYNWLWCLKAIIELNKNYSYPFFMQNNAWLTKGLNSALANWAELRHDAILYAKQSVCAECGEGDEKKIWYPEPPKGYVEPNLEFYIRLLNLSTMTKDGLVKRNLLTREMKERFDQFIELVTFLKRVAEKESNNIPRTLQEYDQIRIFGTLLENITTSIISDDPYARWWSIESDVDKNIALIADVHTGGLGAGEALEEGVGYAHEIYVIVEIEGLLKLTRGAVFSYYEFKRAADDRLTDEKWQEILKQKNEPPLPDWIDVYFSPIQRKLPKPAYVPKSNPKPGWYYEYTSGC